MSLYNLKVNKNLTLITVSILISLSLITGASFIKNNKKIDEKYNEDSSFEIRNETSQTERLNFISDGVNLDTIFSYKEPLIENNSINESGKCRLLATGDIVIGRSVNYMTVTSNNFKLPFEKTAEFLKSFDITFVNFESPLVEKCPITIEGMIFCGDKRNIEGLVYSGIDIVNLANNHMGNFGKEGIDTTVKLLEEKEIAYTGLGEPSILEVNGKKFGFLGYNEVADAGPYVSGTDPSVIEREIKQLRDKVDFLVVAFHWGVEYTSNPSDNQVKLAHLVIDSGADLIIGNHPHWVQGVEIYKDRFISYAHGNFIFDQMWSEETREGVIGEYIFDDKGLIGINYYPIIIENYNQPRFAVKKEAEKILTRMRDSSLNLIEHINCNQEY